MKTPTKTQEKILASAEQCFFQHGYQKSNMSLVSKYSGFSRVTVHKHFCTKKQLFREVVRRYFETNLQAFEEQIEHKSHYSAWQAIHYLTEVMLHPMFEQIGDQFVLEDLDQACQQYANDIKNEMKQNMILHIKHHIDRGIEDNMISLNDLEMDSLELATLLDNSLEGVIINTDIEKTRKHINAMLKVYQVATQPK